jgi:hypothetical protein
MTRGKLVRRWSPVCLAVVVAALSGCEGYLDEHPAPSSSKHAKAHTKTVSRPTELVSVDPAAQPRSAVADGTSYVGLAEAQLIARLGQPSLRREDQPPGKTWRYQNRSCTVDFMLYPDVETRIYRALAYEVINDDKSAAGKRLCLAELESRAHDR